MKYTELKQILDNRECYLKEIFFTRRTVYEIVNNCDIRICNITYAQSTKIHNSYSLKLFKENYSGFTKRWYKINKN